jgi:hypothetical protein
MEDDEFLRGLCAITGRDAATWEGFDPTSWRSFQSDGEGSEAVESNGGVALTQDYDYASDDSADMILNFHKLTPAEKGQTGKLSKARQFASEEVGLSREVARLERVKWKETGLAAQDVSPDGETFVAWRLVQNYPDMFVGKANGARVSIRSQSDVGMDELTDYLSRPRRCLSSTRFMRTVFGTCKPSLRPIHLEANSD